MKSQRGLGSWVACGIFAAIVAVHPQSASAVTPVFMEETTRISSPDSAFPLNGAIAVDGNVLLAGSSVRGDSSSRHAVFLFERRSATSWKPVRKLLEWPTVVSAPLSLSISGATAAMSAGVMTFVFELQSGVWRHTATLKMPAGASITSDTAVTSSLLTVGGIAEDQFVSYVYEKSATGQWTLNTRLAAGPAYRTRRPGIPQVDAADRNGVQRIAIGSPNYNPNPPEDGWNIGDVYVFQRDASGSWQRMEVNAGASHQQRTSGEHVALDEILVFAPGGPGNVIVWSPISEWAGTHYDPPWWARWPNMRPPDELMNGSTLAIATSNDRFVAAEPEDEDRGTRAGSVTVSARQVGGHVHFDDPFNEDPYVQKVKLLASNARSGLELGRAVGFSGEIVAASSSNGVYVFDLTRAEPERPRIHENFEDGVADGWSTFDSTWTVVSHNRSMVYRQTSTSGESASALTDITWRNQAIHADVRPLAFSSASAWTGLFARYTNAQNYYAVRLRTGNRIEIVKRLNGVETVIGSASSPVMTNVNSRVRFEAIGTWLRVYVNGLRVVQARDSTHKQGAPGLSTFNARAQFDNLLVSHSPALVLLYDNFESGELSFWESYTLEEDPRIITQGENQMLRIGGRYAQLIGGLAQNVDLQDQIIECRVRVVSYLGEDAAFGFMARQHQGQWLRIRGDGRVVLFRPVWGQEQVLSEGRIAPLTPGKWYRVRLEAVGDWLLVYVDGQLVLTAIDPAPDPGGPLYGVWSEYALIEVDNFLVQRP